MAIQTYANLAQGTLSTAYTAGNSSLVLSSGNGAAFPTTGNFVVALDDPPAFFLQATARSSDTITVNTSAIEGTTAINEAIGIKVTQVITAGVFNATRLEDAGGLQPVASTTGAPQVSPLPTSGWTVFNSAILNDFSVGMIEVFVPQNGTLNLRGITRTIAVPYTLIALIDSGVSGAGSGTQDAGLILSDGTKYIAFDLEQAAGTKTGTRILNYTNVNSTSVVHGPTAGLLGNLLGLKIVNDNTHRTYYTWGSGAWTQFYQESTGTFLTETAAGLGGFSGSGAPDTLGIRLLYWSVT